jgi:hypothetical protein
MRFLTLSATALLAILSSATWAQSAAEHDTHHPEQKEAPGTTQPKAPAPQPGMGSSQGMMGGKMPMRDMMQSMGMMRQDADGMGGMEMIDHVEGRIAFLRAELKITDAQTPAWNGFADVMRTNAKTLGELRRSMMSQSGGAPSLIDRMAVQEKWLAARLDGTRAIKTALVNLSGAFSDEQKSAADELLAPHTGMMATMPGMQGGQTMGMGQVQRGMPAR